MRRARPGCQRNPATSALNRPRVAERIMVPPRRNGRATPETAASRFRKGRSREGSAPTMACDASRRRDVSRAAASSQVEKTLKPEPRPSDHVRRRSSWGLEHRPGPPSRSVANIERRGCGARSWREYCDGVAPSRPWRGHHEHDLSNGDASRALWGVPEAGPTRHRVRRVPDLSRSLHRDARRGCSGLTSCQVPGARAGPPSTFPESRRARPASSGQRSGRAPI